jgi:hypothetical protein
MLVPAAFIMITNTSDRKEQTEAPPSSHRSDGMEIIEFFVSSITKRNVQS